MIVNLDGDECSVLVMATPSSVSVSSVTSSKSSKSGSTATEDGDQETEKPKTAVTASGTATTACKEDDDTTGDNASSCYQDGGKLSLCFYEFYLILKISSLLF